MRCATLCLLLAGSGLAAGGDTSLPEQNTKTASSRIVHVTVYQSTALVTREVDVPAGQGSMEVIVTPLPPQAVNSSLYSEGNDSIRVLTTRFRTRAIREDTREEVRDLNRKLKELGQAAQKIQGDLKALEANIATLGKMESFAAVTTVSATEKGMLSSEQSIALAKFVMEQRKEKSKDMVELQQQLQANTEAAEFLKRKLQELSSGAAKTERDAVIIVDKRDNNPGKIKLNYLVDSAGWRPQYKLRSGAKDKEPVQLEYLAAIVQQSGEDWSNVEVTLSTAQPMLNATPPELKILEVSLLPRSGVTPQPMAGMPGGQAAQGSGGRMGLNPANPDAILLGKEARGLRSKAQDEWNRKKEADGVNLYNEAAGLEQSRDLIASREELFRDNNFKARRDEEGPSVTYHLKRKFQVPSRHDEQVLEVAKLDMAPEYYFKAVPVLTPHVYRQANLTNKSEYVLLPGEATMYQGSDFVGRMNLPLVAIGEQYTVGFGVDPQLQIQRQLVDKLRTQQGANQVLTFDYRLLVNSYKTEPVKLQIWDRLPRAENETAGINLVKATPEVSADPVYLREQRPFNLLRWDLTVTPNMNGDKALAVKYQFRLEMDRNVLIGNFLTK